VVAVEDHRVRHGQTGEGLRARLLDELQPLIRSRELEQRRRRRAPEAPMPDRLLVAVRAALLDVLGIARELLAWPLRILLGIARAVGRALLAVGHRAVLPLARLVIGVLRAALHWGEREVTPARGLCIVAVAASVALGASQFSDYRAVQVGAPQYRTVQSVAPAPEVDQKSPRSAHGVAVFVIAVACLFVTVFAATRNWRLARLLLFLGAAVVLLSLIVDLPQGLREGSIGLDYEGANAVLLGGFWAQLFSAATLMVIGPLLAVQLRAERDARRAAGRVSARPPRRLPETGGGTGMEEPAT
jgi:hypothetical protein